MDQNWDALVKEGKEIANRKDKDQWYLGELASKVEIKYGQNKLGEYAAEIGEHRGTLRSYRQTVQAWPTKNERPRSFSVARDLNAHPDRVKIVAHNSKISNTEARAIMKEWRDANRKSGSKKKQESNKSLNRREIENEIQQRVQEGIDAWMQKFRPHLEDAKAVKAGRKGLVSQEEGTVITRCLHPDNSASEGIRNKAFTIWKRISHLLMSEQDAPTVIELPRRKKSA